MGDPKYKMTTNPFEFAKKLIAFDTANDSR